MRIIDTVGYARVSTREQKAENQVAILSREGIPEDYIFKDVDVSGTIPAEKRPAFKKMMAYIDEHPEVNRICVFEISRLGRTMIETANLIEKLENRNIIIWSLSPTEGFMRNTDKSIRSLLIMLMSWVAQRERENLVARTKAGLDRAREEGKQIGKPRAVIDFEAVKEMRDNGYSWEKIAKLTGYTPMTIYRARKRRGEV